MGMGSSEPTRVMSLNISMPGKTSGAEKESGSTEVPSAGGGGGGSRGESGCVCVCV